MKHLLIVIAMFLLLGEAFGKTECKIELQQRGVWDVECPRNSFVVGANTSGNISGNPRFPHLFLRTRVKCVEPVIVCEEIIEEKVDRQLEED